jgi:regulatory protein
MDVKITALKVQKRNPNRVNVYLDGEFAFGLARIVAAWLQVGQMLTQTQIANLQAKDTDEVAFQSALRLLNIRPRSEQEIQRSLVKKGYSEEVIQATLERLRSGGLVDDAAFARVWVENQNLFRPRGRRALAIELRHKGIADEHIRSALDEELDEGELAFQAAQKYARRLAGLGKIEFRNKLGQFLARRGFSYDTISPTVARIWEEIEVSDTQGLPGEALHTQEEERWTSIKS